MSANRASRWNFVAVLAIVCFSGIASSLWTRARADRLLLALECGRPCKTERVLEQSEIQAFARACELEQFRPTSVEHARETVALGELQAFPPDAARLPLKQRPGRVVLRVLAKLKFRL